MTTETKTFIELSDIVTIKLECPTCGIATSIPLASVPSTISAVCQCRERFFDERANRHPSQNQYPAIDSLLAIANNLVALTRSDRTDLRAKIMIGIKTDK